MTRYTIIMMLAFLSLVSFPRAATWNALTYNSIRIACLQRGDILGLGEADSFLRRAKNAHYNYVLAPFYLQPGDTDDYAVIKRNFILALRRVDAFGLRLIPEIQMGGVHADHWNNARLWNPNIQMVRFIASDGRYGCPSLSYDPTGIDWTFTELLGALRDAFKEASVSFPLEFFHVGHNELAYYDWLVAGNCKTGKGSGSPFCGDRRTWSVAAVSELCTIDCDYINRFTGSKSEAVRRLLVGEVFRRMTQVRTIFGPRTKLMIFADMWDPMFFSQRYIAWNNDTVNTADGILDLPGLPDDSSRARFKENVILMPWTFQQCAAADGGGRYDAATTFSTFAANGFHFVYMHAFHQDKDRHEIEDTAMSREWRDASLKFRGSCLGYAAASLVLRFSRPPSPAFNILESLAALNADGIPAVDFSP